MFMFFPALLYVKKPVRQTSQAYLFISKSLKGYKEKNALQQREKNAGYYC